MYLPGVSQNVNVSVSYDYYSLPSKETLEIILSAPRKMMSNFINSSQIPVHSGTQVVPYSAVKMLS
jgi:hypothetical protein